MKQINTQMSTELLRKYLNIINEAASDVVFHSTSLENALSILKSRTLKFSSIADEEVMDRDSPQITPPWLWYFSTSRTPANSFATLISDEFGDERNSIHVTFKLSGQWFNQRGFKSGAYRWGELHKINPADFLNLFKNDYNFTTQPDAPKLDVADLLKNLLDDPDLYKYVQSFKPQQLKEIKIRGEKEDRILSKTEFVKINDPVNSCILECYVYIKQPFNQLDQKRLEQLQELNRLAANLNIKIKFFDEQNHWLTPMKRAGIPLPTKNS